MTNQGEKLWGSIIIAQPISYYVITFFLSISTLTALFFLVFFDYQRKQAVTGILIPEKGIVNIYPTESGLLTGISIKEGSFVNKGEHLLTIGLDQRYGQKGILSDVTLAELKTQEDIIQESLEIEQDKLNLELKIHEEKILTLNNEIQQLGELLTTLQRIVKLESISFERAETLFKQGMLSNSDVENLESKYLNQKSQLQNLELKISNKQYEIQEAKSAADYIIINSDSEINSLKSSLSALSIQQSRVRVEHSNMILSPIDGRVSSILSYLGQRVEINSSILSIIPSNSLLQANLYLPTNAIGFIEVGQSVNIRYDAFPYQKFGIYTGKISQISLSVISPSELSTSLNINEPTYKVLVDLDQQSILAYGNQTFLKPGMKLSADVILDNRSLVEWLLAPLYSIKGKL